MYGQRGDRAAAIFVILKGRIRTWRWISRQKRSLDWNLPRWLMTLTIVAVIFGVFAIGLVLLLIYKSTLTMRRDDQLFLDDASSHMHAEQTELLAKVNRLNIPVRILSVGSGIFLLVLVAMWLYQKLDAVQ